MDDEKVKEVDRKDLQDEILCIIFRYLMNENKKKDKLIQMLWKERKREDG